MSSNRELRDAGRVAIEVRYTVHREPGEEPTGAASFDDAISNAARHLEGSHLGVHVESRARVSCDCDCAVSLLVSGGFDSGHLDSIWLHALSLFGLSARRVGVGCDRGFGLRIQPTRIFAIDDHHGVAPRVSPNRAPALVVSSVASMTGY